MLPCNGSKLRRRPIKVIFALSVFLSCVRLAMSLEQSAEATDVSVSSASNDNEDFGGDTTNSVHTNSPRFAVNPSESRQELLSEEEGKHYFPKDESSLHLSMEESLEESTGETQKNEEGTLVSNNLENALSREQEIGNVETGDKHEDKDKPRLVDRRKGDNEDADAPQPVDGAEGAIAQQQVYPLKDDHKDADSPQPAEPWKDKDEDKDAQPSNANSSLVEDQLLNSGTRVSKTQPSRDRHPADSTQGEIPVETPKNLPGVSPQDDEDAAVDDEESRFASRRRERTSPGSHADMYPAKNVGIMVLRDDEEIDERSFLEVFGEFFKEYLTQRVIPETDEDCRWDWRSLRCEPACQCVLNVKWGDFHLGRSCRLRMPDVDDTSGEICIPVNPALVLREAPVSKQVISIVLQSIHFLQEFHRVKVIPLRHRIVRSWESWKKKTCQKTWDWIDSIVEESQKLAVEQPENGSNNVTTCIPASVASQLRNSGLSVWERVLCGPIQIFPICESNGSTSSIQPPYSYNP